MKHTELTSSLSSIGTSRGERGEQLEAAAIACRIFRQRLLDAAPNERDYSAAEYLEARAECELEIASLDAIYPRIESRWDHVTSDHHHTTERADLMFCRNFFAAMGGLHATERADPDDDGEESGRSPLDECR